MSTSSETRTDPDERRFAAEIRRINRRTEKFIAERDRLEAEQLVTRTSRAKRFRETFLYPAVLGASAFAAGAAFCRFVLVPIGGGS